MEDVSSMIPALIIGVPMFILGLFLGPVWSSLSRTDARRFTLDEIHVRAGEAAGRRVIGPSRRASPPDSGNDQVLVWGIGAVAAVGLYVKYQAVVLLTIFGLAGLLSVVAALVLLMASRRGVVVPSARLRLALLMPFVFTVVGFFTVVFLRFPPAGGAKLREYLQEADGQGVLQSLDGFGFVFYQLMGAVAFMIVALGSIAFSLANLSGLYIATHAWGQPLWKCTYRWVSGAASTAFVLVLLVVCAVALGLSGGWVYEWVSASQDDWPA